MGGRDLRRAGAETRGGRSSPNPWRGMVPFPPALEIEAARSCLSPVWPGDGSEARFGSDAQRRAQQRLVDRVVRHHQRHAIGAGGGGGIRTHHAPDTPGAGPQVIHRLEAARESEDVGLLLP
eukprot:scaffold38071_cov107-Isochrysis_galbana.AAC.5